MTIISSRPLDETWKKRLDLEDRESPEFYESINDVRNSTHAGAIRATLEGLGASAVFCVQGVPTIVILSLDKYERETVVDLHAALWNQGLASLLLVIAEDIIVGLIGKMHSYFAQTSLEEVFQVRAAITGTSLKNVELLRDLIDASHSANIAFLNHVCSISDLKKMNLFLQNLG